MKMVKIYENVPNIENGQKMWKWSLMKMVKICENVQNNENGQIFENGQNNENG